MTTLSSVNESFSKITVLPSNSAWPWMTRRVRGDSITHLAEKNVDCGTSFFIMGMQMSWVARSVRSAPL